jgi:two-component system OmpR family sensor kinase
VIRRWLPVLIPLGAGLALAAVFVLGWLPNPTLFMRADMAAIVQVLGLIAALALWGRTVYRDWLQSKLNETRQAEENLAAEDRRRFLQRLDHELKNPLTAIQAGLANLGENPDAGALESVKAQTNRLSRLVADLRKLADLETRPLEQSPVSVSEILQTLVELARSRAAHADNGEDRPIRISLSLPQAPWPLPEVSGDYDLLMLAMHNLLDNALKFARPGDAVEVRAFEYGASVVVEVADTGQGIATDELPHVWQELYRGKGARGIPGSGLGLALVRAVVERHDGQVTLRSRAGQGTVVGIRLPIEAG